MGYRFRLLLFCLTSVWSTVAWAQPSFSRADAYALAASPVVESSVSALGGYLKKAGPTETERARAAFTWVAYRIAYDAALFYRTAGQATIVEAEQMRRDPRFAGQMPEVVLRDRKAVCLGYSRLLEALCRQMGLVAYTANGTARGNGVAQGQGPNHAWNIVRADGSWHLMDATWAAGHLGPDRHFVQQFTDSLFFAQPSVFVQDHLPADPAFQLLDKPVSAEGFRTRRFDSRIGLFAFADSLNAMAPLSDADVAYRSSARALAFDSDALYARLKLTEFHTTKASEGLQQYQKGIEAFNRGDIETATPDMLAVLAGVEAHLQQSRRLMDDVPRAQLQQIPSARENLHSIEESLKYISSQRQFWAKIRAEQGN